MVLDYKKYADIMKVLTEPNRLMILDMLSCGELCACDILEKLHITQPTLSHHMKILCESNLTLSKKVGKNSYYRLNPDQIESLQQFLENNFHETSDCICK